MAKEELEEPAQVEINLTFSSLRDYTSAGGDFITPLYVE
jgi:hypothetical protein